MENERKPLNIYDVVRVAIRESGCAASMHVHINLATLLAAAIGGVCGLWRAGIHSTTHTN